MLACGYVRVSNRVVAGLPWRLDSAAAAVVRTDARKHNDNNWPSITSADITEFKGHDMLLSSL